MSRLTLICAVFLTASTNLAFADAPAPRTVIERGIAYLQKATLDWKDAHSCASCHHAPLMLWSCCEAERKGYAVDRKNLDLVRDWIYAPNDAARVLPSKQFNAFPLAAAYVTLAMAAAPPAERSEAALASYRDEFHGKQEDDGSFLINGHFPSTAPILEPGGNGTCMAVLALDALPGNTPDLCDAADRAALWLDLTPATASHQERALRLLVAARVTHPPDLDARCMDLLALQNPDGSWSQDATLPGDAYATGQALLALGSAGLRNTSPPIADAIAYLARTQSPDGHWPIHSRAIAPDGSGAKNLDPITGAAAAWAVLGLLAVS